MVVDELINNKKYKEALDYLKDLNDEESLYKRAVCLYNLERFDELNTFCELYLENAGKHYYEMLLLNVDGLTKIKNYDTAVALLEEELKMPWIPMQYEEKIRIAYSYLIKLKNDLNNDSSYFDSLNNEELVTTLEKISEYRNKDKTLNLNFDLGYALSLLNVISKRNVRLFLPYIKDFLINPNKVMYLKVILIEILKSQGVNENLKVVNDKLYLINPINASDIFMNANITAILNLIEEKMDLKDNNMLQYMETLLIGYLASIYPNKINDEENKYIAAALYMVANNNNYLTVNEDEIINNFSLNKELFNRYYQKIANVEIY